MTRAGRCATRHGRLIASAGLALVLAAAPASAQDLSRYRGYVLDSPLAAVTAAAGTRPSDLTIRHERPSRIEHLEWRAPYTNTGAIVVDPVEGITFAFIDGQLYELTVAYDRHRTEGMTTADLVAAMVTTYGPQAPGVGKTSRAAPASPVPDTVVLARWEDSQSVVTLVRGSYEDVQLIVRSKTLGTRAAAAIKAALVLDAAEAPARRQEALDTEAADARAERARNKTAFKP